jgi:hypothetical protein
MIARQNKNEAPHKLTDERWRRIEKELRPLMAISARRPSGSIHFARLGGIRSARVEIEFLRSVAVINKAAGHRYKSQGKARRAAFIRSQRHITHARRALANIKQMASMRKVLKDLEVELGDNYREPGFSARDGFVEDLISAWSQWGGRVTSSYREGRADGPLVRFLKACVDDLFLLTESAARNRIQNCQKKFAQSKG